MPNSAKLESRIGYDFKRGSLLAQALTHRSYSDTNNERLEFLGDAILNYIIALALYDQFEDADEGELSRLRSSLVKQPTLADVARDIDLGGFIIMGSGELSSGGFEKDSILSDTLEAIFGAILLDSGPDAASQCVLRLFASRLGNLSLADIGKDAKSRLQEFLQSVGEPLPEYALLDVIGKPPNQKFEVACRSGRLEKPVLARGSSRRQAEQAAAEIALARLGADS